MAQSSIEWLVGQVNSDCLNSTFIRPELIEKAKEMHGQESIAAQMDMFHHLNNLPFGMQYLDKRESAEQFAEQYYNETFGGNNERDWDIHQPT